MPSVSTNSAKTGQYNQYTSSLTLTYSSTQSTATNKSTVSWTLSLNNTYSGYMNCDISLWMYGAWRYESASRAEIYRGDIKSGSFQVQHDDSGNGSFWCEIHGAIYSKSENCTYTGQIYLPKIDRASVISSVPAFNLEDGISCNFTKNNQTFTENLQLVYDSNTIATFTNYTSGTKVYLTDAEILSAYELLGTKKSANFDLILNTYNSGSYVGNSSKTVTGTCAGTLWTNRNGTWVRALPWVNVNGTWKKALAYKNVNNVWKRGI